MRCISEDIYTVSERMTIGITQKWAEVHHFTRGRFTILRQLAYLLTNGESHLVVSALGQAL
jgi:hypothetical protein